MSKLQSFAFLKPFIPRRIQILARCKLISRKLLRCKHLWPIDPESATPPDGWKGWPEGKKFALVLTHDVEKENGLEKCRQLIDLEKRMGFRSSFNFVAGDYDVPPELRYYIEDCGFEIGIHGLYHKENPFKSRKIFKEHARQINKLLKQWNCVGFRSPCMFHNLDYVHDLNIEYDASTFDTDPFEPQPDGVGTIFPFYVKGNANQKGYVELPYTLSQDFLLFILMQEHSIDIWKKKLDWIARHGGMALITTHPDYMNFDGLKLNYYEYSASYYEELLNYVKEKYEGQYWHVLPREMARFWACNYKEKDRLIHAPISKKKKIWIDLDNSPHVPFFKPIIDELNQRGYAVILTARDCFQVCGLADLVKFEYKKIGRHYGKNKFLKVAGLLIRALQLIPITLNEKPDLSLSHGSRSQILVSSLLGIPSILIADYEYTQVVARPSCIMVPELISEAHLKKFKGCFFKYPGIKEDVYVPNFKPDPRIKKELGISDEDILVTIRPPATEAHYHNPESEQLFIAAINLLGNNDDVRIVVLPRNEKKQTAWIENKWSELCKTRKIIIPDHVVDGLNLIWHSDLVISGGGTMNREAAALGVPVYSIFRGKIGDVDQYLSDTGRLVLLKTVDDVKTRISIDRRQKPTKIEKINRPALKSIVDNIVKVVEYGA